MFRWFRPAFGLVCALFLAIAPAKSADFRIEYLAARTTEEAEVLDRLRSSERLHHIVLGLGEFLRLPFPVRVEVGGPAEGPFYDAAAQTIGLPYSFLAAAAEAAAAAGTPDPDRLILDLAAFVFCHEVGHALFHALGLHGRIAEEPAADELAVLLVTEALDEGLSMARTLGAWWARDGQLTGEPYGITPDEWREEERRRRVLCLLWGSDPGFLADPPEPVGSEERGDCRAEYLLMRGDWLHTLTPFLLQKPRADRADPFPPTQD